MAKLLAVLPYRTAYVSSPGGLHKKDPVRNDSDPHWQMIPHNQRDNHIVAIYRSEDDGSVYAIWFHDFIARRGTEIQLHAI